MKHPQITDLNQNYVLSGRLARDVISNINSLPENLQDNSLPQNQSPFVIGAVCNDTAASYSLSQGYIMGLGDLVITPSAANATAGDPKQWLNLPKTYYVEKYDPSTHAKFCVLISPSPASNKTAIPAIVGGMAKVKVDVLDITHKYATFKSTQPDMPSSSTPFPCQLETAITGEFELANPVTETGEQWCSVQFPVGGESGSYDNPYNLKWTEPTEEPYLLECDYPDRVYNSSLGDESNSETIYNFAHVPTEQEEADPAQTGVIIQQAVDFRIDEVSGFQKLVCNFHYDSGGKLLAITDPEWKTFAYVKSCYFPTPS